MRRLPFARSLRSLWRQPRLTVPAILTLGLGLGAATAVFTLVDVALLRPLPFPAPERLVGFWGQGSWSRAELDFMRRHSQSYEAVGSFTDDEVILSASQPRVVPMAWTSPDFFHVLAATPALGRTFQPEEEQPGRTSVVVLSDGFWRRELGADADAVGKTLELGGELHEVVGVMPPGFSFPLQETELWIPVTMDSNSGAYQGHKFLSLIGRRHAEVSLETISGPPSTAVPEGLEKPADAASSAGPWWRAKWPWPLC